MLHLAQIQKNANSGERELVLLAHQNVNKSWDVDEPSIVPLTKECSLSDGVLVLVEVGEDQNINTIQDAKNWVIGLVQNYLFHSDFAAFIEEEKAKVEQWRQDLTLQSQDLTRRSLELETRREEIQELEKTLKREQED
ncbi:MAG: hypothetical protein ACOC0N_12850 [Chroococcales cyanobacterium]